MVTYGTIPNCKFYHKVKVEIKVRVEFDHGKFYHRVWVRVRIGFTFFYHSKFLAKILLSSLNFTTINF